ncbi:MAG TPA: Holliday junction branch migration protein RuvA [Nitrospiria bacterium]
MIASLTGKLFFKNPQYLIVDVNGVGYKVFLPLSSFYGLPEVNEQVVLFTHTHVREDALQLFGFLTTDEFDVFLLLLGTNGVGPRLALNILSGLSVPDIKMAIEKGDVRRLASIPGVGKKTAARLALELKEKIGGLPVSPIQSSVGYVFNSEPQERIRNDALAGLVYLGYPKAQGRDAIEQLLKGAQIAPSVEQLIKDSLRLLSRG